MKSKSILILVCLILFASIGMNHEFAKASNNTNSTVISKEVNEAKYVNANGGLIMRDAANSKGKKVTMLKDGSKVFVYSTDTNGWSFVKQGNLKGYVKDSFLTTKSKTTSNKSNSATKKRVIDFSMSVNQVKKMEPAKLSDEVKEGNITVLEYEVEKFGYGALLQYYFIDGKLNYIIYDFLPDKNTYDSWSQMSVMFDRLDKGAVKAFGKGVFVSDKYTYLTKMWEKDNYSIMLRVDDNNLYTTARLVFHQ